MRMGCRAPAIVARLGASAMGTRAPVRSQRCARQLVLTPRELDVVRLLARGCHYAEIGKALGVAPNTIATHIKNAYRKLKVHTAAAAVMRAVELRLLETKS